MCLLAVAAILMAKAFPASRFTGIDISSDALEAARADAEQAQLLAGGQPGADGLAEQPRPGVRRRADVARGAGAPLLARHAVAQLTRPVPVAERPLRHTRTYGSKVLLRCV